VARRAGDRRHVADEDEWHQRARARRFEMFGQREREASPRVIDLDDEALQHLETEHAADVDAVGVMTNKGCWGALMLAPTAAAPVCARGFARLNNKFC